MDIKYVLKSELEMAISELKWSIEHNNNLFKHRNWERLITVLRIMKHLNIITQDEHTEYFEKYLKVYMD